MDDIATWLEALGLGIYAERFAANDVDLAVLPDLTDRDLETLGVSLGHRRKLQRAIAALSGGAGGAHVAAAQSAAGPTAAPAAAPRDLAERRQLTVMFCDLVGSTALSARLDPEDMRAVIRAYQQTCAQLVESYEGFLAKFMGDGVLAYFGFPRAHEDDAERAVRAGLGMVAAVAKLVTPAGETLQARIGIATGMVVVGDLIGEGVAQEQAVVGDTPNLAARLQALALPGTVVVAAATRRLLGSLFDLRDLGPQSIKGLAEPVGAWAVEGLAASESRFEAARSDLRTGFIGREEELEILLERQRQALAGQGQVVLVSGAAGIGKSRIADWLGLRVAAERYTRFRYQCSPYHANSALYPFIGQLERAAGFKPDDPPDARLAKLERLLAPGTAPPADTPLFAALLSIPFGGRYPPLALSPAQQRRQTFAALLGQLEAAAGRAPLFVLFEDAQWADATSLELLDLAIDRIARLPILALITFRPEFQPPWAGLPHVTAITLGKLKRRQIREIVQQVTGGKPLPPEVLEQIVAKTDGVPLFVEELTKTVLESGQLVEEDGGYRLEGALTALAIPATLQDSLMARLDRLAPIKEIAQIGALIGREFPYALLGDVAERDEAALRPALAQLEDAELLTHRGERPDDIFLFKQALVQDAAYGSLLKSRRQQLHRRIGETLRDRFATMAETEPEILAHHFTQGGETDTAFEWWGKAGDRALRRSAYVEAIAHLRKALAMPEAADGAQKLPRLRLQIAYGQALIATQGFNAPETTAAFARAHELAAGIEDAGERFSIYYGLWVGSYVRGELAPMRKLAAAFLADAEQRPESPEAGIAHRIVGTTCWFQGDYAGARTHHEKALAAYDPERDRDLAFRFGQDAGVSAMLSLAIALWPLGEIERARKLAQDAIAHAQKVGTVATLAYAHLHKCLLDVMREDPGIAQPQADALVALSREHGLQQYLAIGTYFAGWARWHGGDKAAGASAMREGRAQLNEVQGVALFAPLMLPVEAQADAEPERIGAGLAELDGFLVTMRETGQSWFDAELNRRRGMLLLRSGPGDTAAAEAAFRAALAIAREQKTPVFELRAALALARVYNTTGRGAEIRALLAPVLAGFVPGAELPEVTEATELVAVLA